MNDLRLNQMTLLATSCLEGVSGYLRSSEPIVNLGLLTEIERIVRVSDQLAMEVATVNEQGLAKGQKNSAVRPQSSYRSHYSMIWWIKSIICSPFAVAH